MAISLPLIDCSVFSGSFNRSCCCLPSEEKRISPLVYFAVGDNNCSIAREVTDLPDPDSPAMPTISFLSTVRLIFFIAVTFSVSEIKSICRSFISSKG